MGSTHLMNDPNKRSGNRESREQRKRHLKIPKKHRKPERNNCKEQDGQSGIQKEKTKAPIQADIMPARSRNDEIGESS